LQVADLCSHRIELIVGCAQLLKSALVSCPASVEFRSRSIEFALSRQVPPAFSLQCYLRLGERLAGGCTLRLQLPCVINGPRQFVAVDERRLERHRLVLTALSSPVRSHAICVRPPLPRPTSLAGNCHESERNETQRFRTPIG
jgi:hypothetical protein